MVKESPLTPVNKPRRSLSEKGKKSSSSRRTSGAGKKKKPTGKKGKRGKKRTWNIPSWLQYVAMGGIAALFVIGFYYFFIRPYAYRWKPCYGTKAYGVCLPAGYRMPRSRYVLFL